MSVSSPAGPRRSPGQPPDTDRAAEARGPARVVVSVLVVVGARGLPQRVWGGAQQGGRGRLWLYLARVDSGVCAARLQVGVHVAADRARAREARRVFLVHVAGATLAVGEALIAEGTEVGLGTQHDARVPQAGVPVALTVARVAADTATCKRHGVRAGGGAASRRVKQAAAAAGAKRRAGHHPRVGQGWRG